VKYNNHQVPLHAITQSNALVCSQISLDDNPIKQGVVCSQISLDDNPIKQGELESVGYAHKDVYSIQMAKRVS
jgi:hypothetical protein